MFLTDCSKNTRYKIHENPSRGGRVSLEIWTDILAEVTTLLVDITQLCDLACKYRNFVQHILEHFPVLHFYEVRICFLFQILL